MDDQTSKRIIAETAQTYNAIAKDFDQTRKLLWTGLDAIDPYVRQGFRVLDLGCGNGRLLEMLKGKDIEYTGVDFSEELIKIARAKYPGEKFLVGNALSLPFRDSSFDMVLCVAVLHHLPGKASRLQALKEILRVLRPGGYLFLTNWWRLNPRNFSHDVLPLLKSMLQKLSGKSKLDFMDAYIPWGKSGEKRYYHYFTSSSQRSAIQKAGFNIEKNFIARAYAISQNRKSKNIITIAQKVV